MKITGLVSQAAANRKRYFDLVEEIERELGRPVDEWVLEKVIDCEYTGRDSVSDAEAERIVAAICKQCAITTAQESATEAKGPTPRGAEPINPVRTQD